MDLTEAQTLLLIDGHFAEQPTECPICASRVQFDRQDLPDGYVLTVVCPKCGQVEVGLEDDPRASSFRDWTANEEATIAGRYAAGQTPRCPVDQTRLRIDEAPAESSSFLRVSCPRCGRDFDREVPIT